MGLIRTDENGLILFYHRDLTPTSNDPNEFEIDEIPIIDGKLATHYTPEKGFWVELSETPLTSEEKIEQLENAILELTTLLAEEQFLRKQNEQAILELSMLIGGEG